MLFGAIIVLVKNNETVGFLSDYDNSTWLTVL